MRLLAVAPRDTVVLEREASGWIGYVRRPAPVVAPPLGPNFDFDVLRVATATTTSKVQRPLELPFLHAVVRREERAQRTHNVPSRSQWESEGILKEADTAPLSDECPVGFEDLVPHARLMPALRRTLASGRAGPLDIDGLTKAVASRKLPRRLPRRFVQRWHPDLVVVLDFCPRLWPYRWDMHRLARRLLRSVGRTGVSLRIINHGPLGPWSEWLAHQNSASPDEPPLRTWLMPPAGTRVLIVSDLGLLLGPSSSTAQIWAKFTEYLRRNNVKPVALVPLGAGQTGGVVPHCLPVLRWSPDALPHPVAARGDGEVPRGTDILLAMMAATRRVDPPLLRAMRRLNPQGPHNAGLEGAAWCHPDVDAVHTATVSPKELEGYLRRFQALPPELQAKVGDLRKEHHRHLRALINHEEALLWESRADSAALALSPGSVERGEGARRFVRKVAATVAQGDSETSRRWTSVARGIVARADAAMEERCGDAVYPLLAALQLRRDPWPAPEWSDPALLAAALGEDRQPRTSWLVRDALCGSLVLQQQPSGVRQSSLVDDLLADEGGARARVSVAGGGGGALGTLPSALTRYVAEEGGGPVQVATASSGDLKVVAAGSLPVEIALLDELSTVLIETALERVEIGTVNRPQGVLSWGCDRSGIFVQSPPLGRWDMRWSGDMLRAVLHPSGGEAERGWMLEANTREERLAPHGSATLRVFISYSHDSDEHEERILAFANRLRAVGIDAETDCDPEPPPASWPHHLEQSLAAADVVLMICSETYRLGLEGEQDVLWEKEILRELLHDARIAGDKFVPVLFSDTSPEQIPTPVKDRTYYIVDTPSGYEGLLRRLTDQPGTARSGEGTVRFGIDVPFGVYAELIIATEYGRASQRLRWMPPGTFLMGSPEDEPGRYENEGPRHEVTISAGFWLFDAPCTQALWQAVMGDNPSYFQSLDRPVEQVSWDNVQEFLERINALVPGLDLVLPSEAQWEYGCRAGTKTAIYTGDISSVGENNAPALDLIAWYGGNSGVDFDLDNGLDSSRWTQKQYEHTRAGTRPVKLKQPNAWGLYDMLGNVWEWCRDGSRTYAAGTVTDPVGPIEAGASRVLRGGSWYYYVRRVRSAYRRVANAGYRRNNLGFRCAQVQEGREPGHRPEARTRRKRGLW